MAIDDSAQPSNTDNRVFHGREAEVSIGDAFDPSGVTDFDAQSLATTFDAEASGNDRSGILTEITLTDPEASVEVQNTFGGQVMTESPHDLVEIEFTARFQDISMIEEMMGEGTQVSTTENGTFTRVSGGTQIGNRPNKSILFRVEKDGDIVNYLMNNAIFQQMGEISLAGDGAAEITGTALCRVADRFVEDNFS
jgi:hypothetical protein